MRMDDSALSALVLIQYDPINWECIRPSVKISLPKTYINSRLSRFGNQDRCERNMEADGHLQTLGTSMVEHEKTVSTEIQSIY